MAKRFILILMIATLVFALAFSCGDDDDDDSSGQAVDDDDDNDDTSDDDDDNDDTTTDDDDNDDDSTEDVEVYQEGDDLVIKNDLVSLRYHLTPGRYSIYDAEENIIFKNAEAAVWSNVVLPRHKWHTSSLDFVEWETADETNKLGEGKNITITRGGGDAPLVSQTFAVLADLSLILADVTVENSAKSNMKIGAIYTLYADSPDGTMHFGDERDIRVLTNGTLNYLEFIAPLTPGTMSTISNWNMLVYNQETGKSLNAGYLSFDVAQPIFYYGPAQGAGRQTFHADSEFEPAKKIEEGGLLSAETLVIDFGQETPFDALETYANRIKAWLEISTWLERHPEIGVPVGWNSWSGSSSSGGYGTGIDEQIIVDNMDFADRELRRWGMNYFQIDDGYALVGDWEVYQDRFPDHGAQNGIEWLFDRAKDMGFQTGIWVEAFNARENAEIFINHPEWFGDPWLFGLVGADPPSLDLTNPVVQDHLADLTQKYKDWGAQWIKLDFAYRAPLTDPKSWYDPNTTRGEFYRTGVKIMRETLGEDIFFLNVAITGWNYGLVDSIRLTLDTMPSWEGEKPEDPFGNQGLKPMYRDAARKYYLHNRVFINHPDLIFFREHKDTSQTPLTLNESQTFATAVALQTGLVKIGDIIVDLEPDWVYSYRMIMPVYQGFPRPLDLFERKFPETWVLPIDDFDEPYTAIGLLNWGQNFDQTTVPYTAMADAAREISVDLEEAGLDPNKTYHAFEFWTQEYLGEVTGTLSETVPARYPRVVALREKLDRPQFMGTNRHVLGGAMVIYSVEWDDTAKTLSGTMEGSIGTEFSPFTHQLTFFAPDDWTLGNATMSAPAGFDVANFTSDVDGNLITLTFDVIETTKEKAQWHPEIEFELEFQ